MPFFIRDDSGGTSSAFRAKSAWIPLILAGAAIALLAGYFITGPHAPSASEALLV